MHTFQLHHCRNVVTLPTEYVHPFFHVYFCRTKEIPIPIHEKGYWKGTVNIYSRDHFANENRIGFAMEMAKRSRFKVFGMLHHCYLILHVSSSSRFCWPHKKNMWKCFCAFVLVFSLLLNAYDEIVIGFNEKIEFF